ncbi:hypothetical protein HMPREF9418_0822 [Neisseria macacae ATCC 33926]|uniref:Uncharacterized protein n=1 Tax=Neisseria macacae ATCC 33926 TaxID=997348 RepID=A0AA36UKG9_9NEIS|nr:hypothetical protein HMPREF9418_0822 [Neisseria macacae ATCC 33926]
MHFLLLTPTLPKTICIIAHKVKKYKKNNNLVILQTTAGFQVIINNSITTQSMN